MREIERLTKASAFECELSDASAPTRLFDRAEETFGRVDILINNAAHCIGDTFVPADDARDWGGRPTMFIDASSIDRHFAVNVRSAALLIAEFSRRHVARGAKWGRIISITTGGAECFPGEVSYGASKNALKSYTRAAGKELARFGVTANLIAPGATQNRMDYAYAEDHSSRCTGGSDRPARRYRRRNRTARLGPGALDQLRYSVRRWRPGPVELNVAATFHISDG